MGTGSQRDMRKQARKGVCGPFGEGRPMRITARFAAVFSPKNDAMGSAPDIVNPWRHHDPSEGIRRKYRSHRRRTGQVGPNPGPLRGRRHRVVHRRTGTVRRRNAARVLPPQPGEPEEDDTHLAAGRGQTDCEEEGVAVFAVAFKGAPAILAADAQARWISRWRSRKES